MNVFHKSQEIGIAVTEDGPVSPLKKMAHRPVFFIEVQSVTLVDPLKDLGERCRLRLDQQVNVIGHKDIGIEQITVAGLVGG